MFFVSFEKRVLFNIFWLVVAGTPRLGNPAKPVLVLGLSKYVY